METLFVLLITALCIILALGLVVLNYILTSYGFYTLAKRRGIKNPWIAWIPYISCWTVGCIAGDYDAKSGINRKWNKILITLAIILAVCFILFYLVMIVGVVVISLMQNFYYVADYDDYMGLFIAVYIAALVMSLVAMVYTICYHISLYKVFESTVPNKSLKYLILYMLVPVVGAICVFKCRNLGYEYEAPILEPVVSEIPQIIEEASVLEEVPEEIPTQTECEITEETDAEN